MPLNWSNMDFTVRILHQKQHEHTFVTYSLDWTFSILCLHTSFYRLHCGAGLCQNNLFGCHIFLIYLLRHLS